RRAWTPRARRHAGAAVAQRRKGDPRHRLHGLLRARVHPHARPDYVVARGGGAVRRVGERSVRSTRSGGPAAPKRQSRVGGSVWSVVLLMLACATSARADVTVERITYMNQPNCIRLTNGTVEVVLTTAIGPRVIRYAFIGGDNILGEVPELTTKT